MTAAPSPATRLREVVVVNEQSGVQWRAGTAMIDGGRIVVEIPAATRPPAEMLANASSTYTICALDCGDRSRRFVNITLDFAASSPRERYVFV